MSLPDGFLDALAERLGPAAVITDAEVIAPHLVEWRGRYHGRTPALVRPGSTAEVAAVVRLCAAAGVAITPQGGNTGLVGGQIPDGEILLSLCRLNRIRSVDPIDDALTAEAGVTLALVRAAAREADRLFPLSLASEGSATVGGLVSTNAGGVHVVRYGMMRALVLGLEVVLADGSVLPGLTSLRKDNTGYDLKQVFIGAEGTLGVVTAATLRLWPQPEERTTAMVALPDAAAALSLLHRLKADTGALTAFELMNRLSIELAVRHIPGVREPMRIAAPYLALVECEGASIDGGLEQKVEDTLGAAMERGWALDAVVAKSEAHAADFWRLRESIPAAHRVEGAQASHDIAVPVSAIPRFLAEAEAAAQAAAPGARIIAFGHCGDGNIHFTVLQRAEAAATPAFPRDAVTEAVQGVAHRLGGSISAEHGIGVARRDELPLYKSPVALAAMRALKLALDPQQIMNPRAMLRAPEACVD